MKSSTDTLPPERLGLLLVGEPWSRKSTLAMHFPDPWILDADNNLQRIAGLPFMKGKRYWYDRLDQNDEGIDIPEEQKWLRALELTQKAYEHKDARYLIFDSMTRIGHYLERYIVTQTTGGGNKGDLIVGGQKMMTQMHWNPYKTLWTKLITQIRGGNKPCIFIAHRKVEKDEVSGVLTYKPLIGGQLADNIGGLFTDVWNCTAEPGMPTADNPSGVNYYVETVPQPRQAQLGTSLGLPPKFKMDWKIIAEKLGET